VDVEPDWVFPLEPPDWVEPDWVLLFPLLLFPLLLFPLLLFTLLLFPLELLAGLEQEEEEEEVEFEEVVCGYDASVAIPQLLSLFLDIQI